MGFRHCASQLAKQFNTLSSERAIETFGIDVDKTAEYTDDLKKVYKKAGYTKKVMAEKGGKKK